MDTTNIITATTINLPTLTVVEEMKNLDDFARGKDTPTLTNTLTTSNEVAEQAEGHNFTPEEAFALTCVKRWSQIPLLSSTGNPAVKVVAAVAKHLGLPTDEPFAEKLPADADELRKVARVALKKMN